MLLPLMSEVTAGYWNMISFHNLIDPSETLILPSYAIIEDNTALDEYIINTIRGNNITVCITLFSNIFSGFTYIVNYSFDNFKIFGFISMDSIVYVSPSNSPETPSSAISITSVFVVVTGKAFLPSITEEELIKRINLQGYNELIHWLSYGSINIVESSGVSFDRLANVLVNNFRHDRNTAENTIRSIGNNSQYHWLMDLNGCITEWIVYFWEI